MVRRHYSLGPRERQAFYDLAVFLALCSIVVFLIVGAIVVLLDGRDVTNELLLITMITGSVMCVLFLVLGVYAAVDTCRSRRAYRDADRLESLLKTLAVKTGQGSASPRAVSRFSTPPGPAPQDRDSAVHTP
jgi:hypothetical protein